MLADDSSLAIWEPGRSQRPAVIVFGNEKGGVGKTTLAMHLAVAMARRGQRVAALDADGRQGSLSRYLDNRAARRERADVPLPGPERRTRIDPAADTPQEHQLADAFHRASDCDVLVVDTPGSTDRATQAAHANADLIVTPVGDSLMDLDALAQLEVERRAATAPSAYTKAVWKTNNARVAAGHAPAAWLVVRNRMSTLSPRSQRDVGELLQVLAARIGFRPVAGVSDRLVLRELFHTGLTVGDLADQGRSAALSPSQRKAAAEIETVVEAAMREAAATAHRVTS